MLRHCIDNNYSHLLMICEGLRTVVKLVDRETLLKEREEKKKVINYEGHNTSLSMSLRFHTSYQCCVFIVQGVLHD